jgi:hypothetical protein
LVYPEEKKDLDETGYLKTRWTFTMERKREQYAAISNKEQQGELESYVQLELVLGKNIKVQIDAVMLKFKYKFIKENTIDLKDLEIGFYLLEKKDLWIRCRNGQNS